VSSKYDPAYDIPDLSDAEGDNLSEAQQELISNWREENQQPVMTTSRSVKVTVTRCFLSSVLSDKLIRHTFVMLLEESLTHFTYAVLKYS